jgi:hypothetical protein
MNVNKWMWNVHTENVRLLNRDEERSLLFFFFNLLWFTAVSTFHNTANHYLRDDMHGTVKTVWKTFYKVLILAKFWCSLTERITFRTKVSCYFIAIFCCLLTKFMRSAKSRDIFKAKKIWGSKSHHLGTRLLRWIWIEGFSERKTEFNPMIRLKTAKRAQHRDGRTVDVWHQAPDDTETRAISSRMPACTTPAVKSDFDCG